MRLYQCLTGSVLPWWETRERVQRLPSWFVFAGADSHFPLDPDGTCRSTWKVPCRSRHSQESTTEFTENHRERWSPGDGRGLHRTPTSRTAQGDRSARRTTRFIARLRGPSWFFACSVLKPSFHLPRAKHAKMRNRPSARSAVSNSLTKPDVDCPHGAATLIPLGLPPFRHGRFRPRQKR
jgi:hypothetical protein